MIKVLIPDMPPAADLMPYLRSIDESKTYVNDGPLVRQLTEKLEAICGVPVAVVSNGTAALELTLHAFGADKAEIGLPALTFSATGLAASQRHSPILYDVDADTWLLDHRLKYDNCDMLIPVATFGKPVNMKNWENRFRPIVVDAAGALYAQQCSKNYHVATCFSMHATKFVGAGEGGFVASANKGWLDEIRSLAKFGPHGTNAKMSEYHAAVALAALGRAVKKSYRTATVIKWYKEHGLEDFSYTTHEYNTLLVVKLIDEVPLLASAMADRGIEIRQWYRPWLDERKDFRVARPLPVTEHLRHRLVGLPFHNFLTEADVAYVMDSLREVIR